MRAGIKIIFYFKEKKIIFSFSFSYYLDNIIDTIDDFTIGYEGKFPIAEIDILKGYFPKTVHFHIKRYNVNELPIEDKEIGEWLLKRWDEKETQLKE